MPRKNFYSNHVVKSTANDIDLAAWAFRSHHPFLQGVKGLLHERMFLSTEKDATLNSISFIYSFGWGYKVQFTIHTVLIYIILFVADKHRNNAMSISRLQTK